MARKSNKAVQAAHEQDGEPINEQVPGEPVPVGEVVDQVLENVVQSPSTQLSNVTYNNARKLPDKRTISVGDLMVQLIDKGDNKAGIGIRVKYPDGREPSEQEKEIIRNNMKAPNGQFPSGFIWKGQLGMWHKEIGKDAPSHMATAIRFDAEHRLEKLADDLKQLHGIQTGFAERAEESKGHGAEPIPF